MESSSAEVRNSQIRAFEQTLRTLRPLTIAELGAPPAPGTTLTAPGNDAGLVDAAAMAIGDGGAVPQLARDAGVPSPAPPESAPAAKINPIGPCTK